MARRQRRIRGPHLVSVRTPSGARWWYVYSAGRHREALGTQDEDEARRRFAAWLARRPQDERGPGAAETDLDTIAREYLAVPHGWTPRSKRTTALRVVAFAEAMAARGVRHPSGVTAAVLDTWRTERAAGVSRATINRDEAVARRMLAWAAERRLCDPTALAGRKLMREPARPRSRLLPSPATIAKVVRRLEADGEHGAALTTATLAATGMRLDEARHLAASWIEADAVHLRPEGGTADAAWTSKGYRDRRIPLARQALDAVRAFVQWRDTGKGGKGKRPGISEGWLAGHLDAATTALGVARIRPHDLRRTWVTEAVRAGVPISTVRDLIGHRDVATTERYVGRYPEDRSVAPPVPAAVKALGRLVATPLPPKGGRPRGSGGNGSGGRRGKRPRK